MRNSRWVAAFGAAAFYLLLAFSGSVRADNAVALATCGSGDTLAPGSTYVLSQDTTGKLCVNATVNASVGGFAPNGQYTSLTATASTSASTVLPTGATVRITNLGSSAVVSCTFATGAATGLVNNAIVAPLSSISRVVGSFDHIACIDQTGSTGSNLVVIEGGSGLGNDSGGGGGGSGGGGAITAASGSYASGALSSGSMVDLGSQADAACGTDNGTCSAIALIKRGNQNATTVNTSINGATPAGTNRIGYVSDDPCTQLTKTNLAIATAAGTLQLVAPSGSTQVYVCSFSLIGAATAVVNLVGGTGATCTTGTPVAALGSTTAASGMSLAANGGLTFGNGGATVVRTTTAGHGLCLIQSGTTALAGNISYVQQ